MPVVVLSDARTMFKNTLHVPVDGQSADADIGVARQKLDELRGDAETLGELRRFFIGLGLHSDKTMSGFEMSSEVTEHAQKRFIEVRQAEHDTDGKIKTDDYTFHRYLTLARYVSIAKYGRLELQDKDVYDEARLLEVKRTAKE